MKIRQRQPDRKHASSIIAAAERDMSFTLALELTEASAPTIIRNIYECFRMLGEALLVGKGIEARGHIAPINELLKLKALTTRPIGLIENLRALRHNINYEGYMPKLIEAQDVISLAKACFEPLQEAVLKKID